MDQPSPPRCDVVWFELYADDLERARGFYQRVFSWTTRPFLDHDPTGGYLMVSYAPGERPAGAIVRRATPPTGPMGAHRCLLYLKVPELDAAVEAVTRAGGRLAEDSRPVGSEPGGGRFCVVEDTEGNLVGLWAAG